MPTVPPRRVTTHVYVAPFSFPPCLAPHEWAACVACGGQLSLHQPDPDTPERLLGVCGACARWHLAALYPGWGVGALVCLPGAEEVLRSTGPPLRPPADRGSRPQPRGAIHDVYRAMPDA